MKNIFSSFFIFVACAFIVSGCAMTASTGKNPWAPPEKKKSMVERWDEESKKTESSKGSNLKPAIVTVAKSLEVAEVIFADATKKMVVAYRLGGEFVLLAKGDIFALRGKDSVLRGVARLDIVDGETLGFVLIAGTASVGDLAVIPGDKLLAEMEARFPPSPAHINS